MMEAISLDGFTLEPKNEIHRRKLEALKAFISRLQQRQHQDGVAKAFLIGSVSEGNVSPESDVDIVVFAVGDLHTVRILCAEAAFEAGLDTGETVQPVVYPLNSYYHPASTFLKQAIKEGKAVYSMDDGNLKRDLLEGKRRLASSYLRVAEYVFDNGDYREAADLAYNAAETAAKALLLLEMGSLPKTHGGIVNRFGDLYIRTGKLPRTLGRDLHLALEIRGRARYEEERVITREDAEEVLTLADRLLDHVEQFSADLDADDEEINNGN